MSNGKNKVERIDAWLVRHKLKDPFLPMGQYISYLVIIACLFCTFIGLLMHAYALISHSDSVEGKAVSTVSIAFAIAVFFMIRQVKCDSYNLMMRFVTAGAAVWYCVTSGIVLVYVSLASPEGRDRQSLGLIAVYCFVQGCFAAWMFAKLWRAKGNESVQRYTGKWKFYQYLMLFFGAVSYLADICFHVALSKALVESFVALMCLTQAQDLYSMGAIPRSAAEDR